MLLLLLRRRWRLLCAAAYSANAAANVAANAAAAAAPANAVNAADAATMLLRANGFPRSLTLLVAVFGSYAHARMRHKRATYARKRKAEREEDARAAQGRLFHEVTHDFEGAWVDG